MDTAAEACAAFYNDLQSSTLAVCQGQAGCVPVPSMSQQNIPDMNPPMCDSQITVETTYTDQQCESFKHITAEVIPTQPCPPPPLRLCKHQLNSPRRMVGSIYQMMKEHHNRSNAPIA